MLLTKFKFVNTDGLKGLMYKGRFIAFEKIDDKLAEELISKTHVLERLPETAPVEQPVATEPAALPEAPAPAALPEAPATEKKNAE